MPGDVRRPAGGHSSGLYAVKPRFVRRLAPVEDALVARRVPADVLTAAGLGASVLAGVAIAAGAVLDEPALWLAVAPLGALRLALNALDGSVARRTGTARPFGLVLNEMADRVGDAVALGVRRLRAMGTPTLTTLERTAHPPEGLRLLAALLVPLSDGDLRRLLGRVVRPDEKDSTTSPPDTET